MPELLGDALYYPYIRVRDANWLKMALLYWDSVTRIVPDGYFPEEWAGTRPAVDAGLVGTVSPTPYLKLTAARFRREFMSRVGRGDNSELWRTIDKVRGPNVVDLHVGKLERELLQELIARRLARTRKDEEVDMDREVGNAYMLCLATEIANQRHLPVVTHDPAIAKVAPMYQFTLSRFPLARSTGIPALVKLDLPFPTAASAADLSWETIIKFRTTEESLREDFRHAVEELAASVPTEGDPDYIKAVIRNKKRKVSRLVKKQNNAFDRLHVQTTAGGLQLTVPTTVTMIAEKLQVGPVGQAIAAATVSIALLVAWWAGYKAETEKLVEGNPYRYLVDVHRLVRQPLTVN